MPPFNKTNDKSSASEYVKKVCEQIRWGRAHNSISEELLDHIEDQKEAFIKKGQEEEEAEKNAILDMGDAVTVGQQLDRTHRPKPDWGIMAILGVCILVSVVLQYYLSLNAVEGGWEVKSYFYSHVIVIPFGIAAMIGMYFVDYSLIGKYPKMLYGVALMITLLLFNFTTQLNSMFIHVFYCELVLIPLYAGIVYTQRGKGYLGLIYCGAVGIITCIAVGLGISAIRLFSINGAIILTAAINKDWFKIRKKYALASVWIPVISVIISPFIFTFWRFKFMFITGGGEYGEAYMLKLIREIVANSNLLGQCDLSASIIQQDLLNIEGGTIEGLLPFWANKYCLIYMIYKFGLVVPIITIILMAFLMIRMFKIVHKQSSQLGYIVSLGVFMAILSECIIFLAANLGICACISYPLPFISMSKISFIVNMGLMGLILSVYRNNSIVRDKMIKMKNFGKISNSDRGLYILEIGKWQLTLRKR